MSMESKGQSTELKGLSTGLKGLSRKFQQIHWGVPFPYPCMCRKKKYFYTRPTEFRNI